MEKFEKIGPLSAIGAVLTRKGLEYRRMVLNRSRLSVVRKGRVWTGVPVVDLEDCLFLSHGQQCIWVEPEEKSRKSGVQPATVQYGPVICWFTVCIDSGEVFVANAVRLYPKEE